MPGPRPLPNKVRRLRGLKERRTPRYASIYLGDPPNWLTPEGKAEWRRVKTYTAQHDVIRVVDRAALSCWCYCCGVFVEAVRDVKKRGQLVPARSSADLAREGTPALVKNPSIQIARDSQVQLRAWAKEFGFTPGGRTGLEIPPSPSTLREAREMGLIDKDEDLNPYLEDLD
jgi:P27 family predicted phage terminase small subunit